MIQRKFISSMKSENLFCCYYLVLYVTSVIGFSEIFRKIFLMSEKQHCIIKDKEGKSLSGCNKRSSFFITLEF